MQRLANALLSRLDEFLRNHTAPDGVDKLEALARLVRLKANLHVAVVARSTCLANVLAFRLGGLANRFAERDARLANIGVNLVLALHTIDKNFEVQLAHATDDGLTRIDVSVNLEGRVLIGQPGQSHAHLFLVTLGFRLYRDVNHRGREGDGAQRDGMVRCAQRISGLQLFQTHAGADVTRINLGNVLTLVRVHLYQTPHTFCLPGARIQNRVACLQNARVDPDKTQLAELIVDQLEAQSRKRSNVLRFTNQRH